MHTNLLFSIIFFVFSTHLFLPFCNCIKARSLPAKKLIVGYSTTCDSDRIISEVEAGVNVIIWFATNLIKSSDGRPVISGGPNHTCVAEVAQQLHLRNLSTAHMISIGGWNAPHPDTSFTGRQWFMAWDEWNKKEISNEALNFDGYDGIDWDLEGNDAPSSPWNIFTPECVELVGTMSQEAKKAGYLVSLVPPQSYADPTTSGFDRSLLHSYQNWHPDFHYRGLNIYTAWLSSRYSTVEVNGRYVNTFDFVDIQLYETWSRATYTIDGPPQEAASVYLVNLTRRLARGWWIDFSSDPTIDIKSQNISIAPQQLVLGFSRGASNGNSIFIWPKDVGHAFAALNKEHPLGVMFWNMDIDGTTVNGTGVKCNLAAEFNKFLHVRS